MVAYLAIYTSSSAYARLESLWTQVRLTQIVAHRSENRTRHTRRKEKRKGFEIITIRVSQLDLTVDDEARHIPEEIASFL